MNLTFLASTQVHHIPVGGGGCVSHIFVTHSSVNAHSVVSTSRLLWITPQRPWGCVYAFQIPISFPWDTHPQEGPLVHRVAPLLTFWDDFSILAAMIYELSTSMSDWVNAPDQRVQVSPVKVFKLCWFCDTVLETPEDDHWKIKWGATEVTGVQRSHGWRFTA